MNAWQTAFDEAFATPAWKNLFPAHRENILYTREEAVQGDRWVIGDLWIDLQKDLAQRLASAKPNRVAIFADVVYVPANFSVTLRNMALTIVARRIEVEGEATIRLDYTNSFGATMLLYTAEIGGKLQAESVTSNPELIPITAPRTAGLWIKYDRAVKQGKAIDGAKVLESKWFEKGSPLWLMAVSAFQMAAALAAPPANGERTPQKDQELRGKAKQMLDFVMRSAKDAASGQKDAAAEWGDLADESDRLKKALDASPSADAIESAQLFARLLNRETPVHERQRRLKEARRASSQRNQAPSYELVETRVAPPRAEDIKYIRHGAQTIGTTVLNGWNRPVRQVTLSGVEIELDELDRSGFLKAYRGQQDIQELHVHADTLVIKTRLHFPQTNVFIYCRELYFEGAEACVDTQPVASEYRASLDKNGADGVAAGDISLYVQRFASTEAGATKHFRAVGGKGQDPDEGEIELSYTLRHLPLLKKEDWESLFTYTHRQVGNTTVPAPDWDKYKDYHPALADDKITGIVYAELKVDGRIVDKKGTQDSPGTGGKGPTPGRPGGGGPGGDIYSTLRDDLTPYVDVSGGASGAQMTSTKGGAGGSPDVGFWFLFQNKEVNGKVEFVPVIEEKRTQAGPDGSAGPAAFKPKGDDGSVKPVDDAPAAPWLTPLNLKSALQYAKDALAGGHTGLAREFLMPYLDALDRRPVEKKDDAILQLESEAATLADQAIQNVDYFGNPPGWVPMLSLESAVKIYQNILKSSIQEIYTAYYLQKAWQAKADRQEALQSLVGLLTKNTEDTQKSLIATRAEVITTMQELKQLDVEIEEKLLKPLKVIEERLKKEADYQTDKAARQQIVAAAFKIFGAIAKAIPLPEPYQMAAGALGTVFDITGEFVAEDGATDKAFAKLKSGVNDFLTSNTDNIIEQSGKKLDESLLYAKKDIKLLQDKAEAASKEKDALQESYDKNKKEHDDLVSKEKKALDVMREKLQYGRSRKKEMVEWMEKEFQDFEEGQNKKLKEKTGDYQKKTNEVKGIEKDIAGKEKKLKESQAAVEKEKKENAKLVKTGIQQAKNIAAGVETVGKTINELMVSRSQLNSAWDKTLAKLVTDDKEFQEVSRQLTALNQRKTTLATQLLGLKTSLKQQTNQISNNLLSVNVLSSQVGSSRDALDPMAFAYMQSVSQEAHQSLMQFLYYVIKAYEYYMVEPWGRSEQGAQKLFESLQNVLEPSDQITGLDDLNEDEQKRLKALLSQPVSFKDNMLKPEDFNVLKVVYEKPLRDMGKRLANQLASGAGRLLKEAPKAVTLGREELDELNSRIRESVVENAIPFSLMRLRQIDQSNEKQRIGNIKVVRVQCKQLGKGYPDTVTFKFSHRGKSVVRAQGRLYAFEPEGGREEERGQRSSVIFTTSGGKTADEDWLIKGDTGILQGKALWQPTVDRQENLLTQFLKSDAGGEAITLSEFRPGVFSDFEMTVEISPPERRIELEELRLQITTEAGDAPKGQRIICASTHPELAIPITASSKDMSERSGGLGSYTGIFKDQLSPVRISVPASFGKYVHTGWCVDGENKPDGGQHEYEVRKSSYVVANFERVDQLFRRTKGIVSDFDGSDPKKEADVILTAATLGFAASYVREGAPIQFDMDPLEGQDPGKTKAFEGTVGKIDVAIADYLKKNRLEPADKVHAGMSPGYTKGAVIVGVYKLAGQSAPPSISAPLLTPKGQALYDKIRNVDAALGQYTGRGAYTGFVDNHNTVENTDPVGPRSTARFLVTDSMVETVGKLHPRWLPPQGNGVWNPRKRKGTSSSYVPWGLIMGDAAGKEAAQPNATGATNLADQATIEMRDKYGMVFNGEPDVNDIATYTHGMIQAIYKAYSLGPSCTPYEIAVGDVTKKMASCLPCTLFMAAAGYPPTSTHLGRGESWAPLYRPYNPGGGTEPNENGVIRDLNRQWYEKCAEFVTLGLEILDDDHIAEDHKASRDAVRAYMQANKGDTVAGSLILDALTIHDGEADRINRTLNGKSS